MSSDDSYKSFIKTNLADNSLLSKLCFMHNGTLSEESSIHCCITCMLSLKKGKVPRMSAMKGHNLKVISEEFQNMIHLNNLLVEKTYFSKDISS